MEGTNENALHSSQEHIIHVWEETGSRFHNCLIQLYCEKVQSLMKDYLLSLPTGTSAHPQQVAPDLKDQTAVPVCSVGKWALLFSVGGRAFRGIRDVE